MSAPEVSAAAVVGTSVSVSVPGLPEGATIAYAWLLDGELIADITAFVRPDIFVRFGLPHELACAVRH